MFRKQNIVIIVLSTFFVVSLCSCSSSFDFLDSVLGKEEYTVNLFGDYYIEHISSLINDRIYEGSTKKDSLIESMVYNMLMTKIMATLSCIV